MKKGNRKFKLTKSEKKIYNAIMDSFPLTSHESAIDIAIQGGGKLSIYIKVT